MEIKSNKEVLDLVQEPRQIIKMIETRKIKFFGHSTFIINIMEEKINGKRGRGRPRDTNLGNTKKLLSLPSYAAIKRLAGIREDGYSEKTKPLDKKKLN